MKTKPLRELCCYFVDEAGDAIIYGKKKATRIGTHGASRFFFIGLLEVEDPLSLTTDLENFRRSLLQDQKLNKLPGMSPEKHLTADKFHATDDHPIIRRLVYKFLNEYSGHRFTCVVRDKKDVLQYIEKRKLMDNEYHYSQEELYDYCTRRIFRDRLHLSKECRIVFAKWNKAERHRELTTALEKAKENFYRKYGILNHNEVQISSSLPIGVGGLQAVDYYLWALQRVFEKQDDSYYNEVISKYSFIIDMDDRRFGDSGMYYSRRKPLTLEGVRERL